MVKAHRLLSDHILRCRCRQRLVRMCLGIWGKGQHRVCVAVHESRQELLFAILGVDSDDGSELINQHLYTYCRREGITFTRSRSYKRNDSRHV